MGSSQWDCRSFDANAYRAHIIQQRAERFSTVFATLFLTSTHASSGQDEQLVAVAYSTGFIKLFWVRDAVSSWLGCAVPASACLAWKAHHAPVMSLACLDQGTPAALLVSAGEDGAVRAWPLSVLMGHASAPGGPASPAPVPRDINPSLEGHISRGGAGPQAGVTCAVLENNSGRYYAGSSEGGIYVFDIRAASADGARHPGTCTLPCIASLAGHLASILCVDACALSGRLASGSEDGTLRIWDVAGISGASAPDKLHPTHTVCPEMGGLLPPNAAAQLQCACSAPPVMAARFQDGGWVVCGVGGKAPALLLWSLDAEAIASQVPLPCTPQVLEVLPGEVLVAGVAPSLLRFSFTGQLTAEHSLASSVRSVFALDVLPGNPASEPKAGCIAPGAIALGGSNGCCDLLSRFGTQLAALYPDIIGVEED